MVPLCVEQLRVLQTGESEAELTAVVEEFVWRLTGKETIYQMMALAEAVRSRGGAPLDPLVYKKMYLDLLGLKIAGRLHDLRAGSVDPERYLVPGSRALLQTLAARNMRLYLASGTDDPNVKEEAHLLQLDHFFGDRIFGAQDDLRSFSKALLVRQILSTTGGVQPNELLVFGDGFVEIEEVKKVGGVAVGVASREPDCFSVDEWKRDRLVGAGADFVVPNYVEIEELTTTIFQAPALVAN